MEMALVMADGSPAGKANPAFPAHSATMGHWAMAVFEACMPMDQLNRAISTAKLILIEAVAPWLKVRGPAAAFIAPAARFEWPVRDAVVCITDGGRALNLTTDPPAVVTREIEDSVRRWRWRNMAARHPSVQLLGGEGPCLNPIWKLLRPRAKLDRWAAAERGAFHSVLTNRQWPQGRCFRASFVVDHNK